ncbi:MAG: TlpA disulfide reductase family protein [Acidimicrobiales bacterium]
MTLAAPDDTDTAHPEQAADQVATPASAAPVADSSPPPAATAQPRRPEGNALADDDQQGGERRGRRRLGPWIALPVLVVVAGLVWIAATAGKPDAYQAQSPLLGKPVPAVTGATVQGGRFDLAAMRGRWVVVNYFATWCRECRVEHPELERFFQTHGTVGDATVVSVVFNDTPKAVREFLAANGGSWPMVIDPGGQIAVNFGVGKVPESYLVSPNGYVVAKIVGGVQASGLDALLQRAKTAAADGPPR